MLLRLQSSKKYKWSLLQNKILNKKVKNAVRNKTSGRIFAFMCKDVVQECKIISQSDKKNVSLQSYMYM
jgi:hypothetical protein